MKIILTSESSINGDLENISAKRDILISKKIVLEIKPHDVGETYNKTAEEFENIVFLQELCARALHYFIGKLTTKPPEPIILSCNRGLGES